MKRLLFSGIGLALLAVANGCCGQGLRGCGRCSPCPSPCASPCASPCGTPYGAPATYGSIAPGASLTPINGQTTAMYQQQGPISTAAAPGTMGPVTTTAMLPLESLPTY